MQISTINLLLVEDDEDDYIITSELLNQIKGKEFQIKWVNNYDAAIKAVIPEHYDVILVDYNLGDRNGLEFLQAAIAQGCQSPIILLTGQEDYEADMQAMQAGAADYLIKSEVSTSLLDRSIRHAMERKRSQEALLQSESRFRELAQKEKLVSQIARQITTSQELNTIIQSTVSEIQSLLNVHRCRFLWYRHDSEHTYFELAHEVYEPNLDKTNLLMQTEAIAEKILQSNLLDLDTSEHSETFQLEESYSEFLYQFGFPYLILIPVMTNFEQVGAIVCEHWHQRHAWQLTDVELLQSVADQLAIAIDQAMLYQKSCDAVIAAETQAQQLERTLLELKQTQARLIQAEKMSGLGQLVAEVVVENDEEMTANPNG